MFPKTGIATVRLLERLGHAVDFPAAQTCCGQLHLNMGYQKEAFGLARRFVKVFADTEVVVAPSASCVAVVRDFYPYLAEQEDDAALAEHVASLAPRVLELTEFLARAGGRRRRSLVSTPSYIPPHLPLAARASPRRRTAAAAACGPWPRALRSSARRGVLRLRRHLRRQERGHVDGDTRRQGANESGADVVAAVDTSCLTQIGGGLSRRGLPLRTLHLAEILADGAA